tara:strand:- start:86 stop:502 length:417 start_codon:yes stop_codon:yes gene_type:complete
MEDYREITKSELIKSFDKKNSFIIKVCVSTHKQPFYDYLSNFNYELEGKLNSIDDDIIEIDGKKNYFFDNDDENLTGIFKVDELTSECYNDCSGETIYYIKYIDCLSTNKKDINQMKEKKHKIESTNQNLKVKQHKKI